MELKDVDFEEIELNKKAGKRSKEGDSDQNVKRTEDPRGEGDANRYDMSEVYDYKGGKKQGKGFLVFGVVLFLLSLTILAGTFILFKSGKLTLADNEPVTSVEEVVYTQDQVDEMLENAISETRTETEEQVKSEYLNTLHNATSVETGTWNLLREYFPDEVVFTDGTKFTYIGVNKELKQNNLDNNGFLRDPLTGYMSYIKADGTSDSHMGIDVSTFQKEIDWQQVKDSGIEFAIIRCGFRGYGSEGKLVEDSMFRTHIEGALNVGLEVGIYFFTQAVTPEEAAEEAEYVLSLIEGYNISGPIVIDVEAVSAKARTDALTGEQITDNVVAFCERIKKAGRTPMIYSGLKYFIKIMNVEKLEPYAKWYAYYNDPLYFPYEIAIWQYSMTGTVPGISGDVDLDIIFEKWW